MKIKRLCNFILVVSVLISLTGCFKVGRLPATTAHGPGYDNPESAIMIPRGGQTNIMMVNNERVRSSIIDRAANLLLFPFLMYLEPQVYVKPGNNNFYVRAQDQNRVDYGTHAVTTTTWRDYKLSADVKSGERYYVVADLHSGARIVPERKAKRLASK